MIGTDVGTWQQHTRTVPTISPQDWEAREHTFQLLEKAIKEARESLPLPLASLLAAESEPREVVVLALVQLAESAAEYYRAELLSATPEALHSFHLTSGLKDVERIERVLEELTHTLGVHTAVPCLHAALGLYKRPHVRGRPSDPRLLQILSGLAQLVKTQFPKQPSQRHPPWYSLLKLLLRYVWPPLPFEHTPEEFRSLLNNYRKRHRHTGDNDLTALKTQLRSLRYKPPTKDGGM